MQKLVNSRDLVNLNHLALKLSHLTMLSIAYGPMHMVTIFFAVVTDCKKESLYVLSRCAWPNLTYYAEVMCYVVNNYDRDRLVQVTHYE